MSISPTRIWRSATQGDLAEGLWCAQYYTGFHEGGFAAEREDWTTFGNACKKDKGLADQFQAALMALQKACEEGTFTRLSQKIKGEIGTRMKSARKEVVDSYEREEMED